MQNSPNGHPGNPQYKVGDWQHIMSMYAGPEQGLLGYLDHCKNSYGFDLLSVMPIEVQSQVIGGGSGRGFFLVLRRQVVLGMDPNQLPGQQSPGSQGPPSRIVT